ncbi:MAG: transposase [Spirochaetia bacterium]|nr:transposase [Spirochaetia bacterium]
MGSKLHTILDQNFGEYSKKYGTPWPVRKVINRVLKCRTEALGGFRWVCKCGYEKTVYRSCRSRSCPQCGEVELKKFIDKKMEKVFPGDHFHMIFTIPRELNKFWLFNTRKMGNILFDTAKKTILKFCDDEKYLGAKPGIMMALHTWGQNLSLHPHIHALVTAGGINKKGKLRFCKKNFLFPVKPAMIYFRYHFLMEVKKVFKDDDDSNEIKKNVDKCFKTNWNIFIKEKYSGGGGVLIYLSRYIRGLPIKDSRIKYFDQNRVTFTYKDYRDNKRKNMTLSMKDFMQKLLLHIPPANFRTFREVGLYHSDKIIQMKDLTGYKVPLGTKVIQLFPPENEFKSVVFNREICPRCQKEFDYMYEFKPNRYNTRASPGKAA